MSWEECRGGGRARARVPKYNPSRAAALCAYACGCKRALTIYDKIVVEPIGI